MAGLDYFSVSRPTQLAAALTNVATAVVVTDGTTYPDPAINGKQYTIILGYGSDREEVCTVTAKPTATTFTVLRGQDGTAATTKNIGDTVVHGVSARDFKRIDTAEGDVDALETVIDSIEENVTVLQSGKYDKTGGPVSGPVVLPGDATAPLHAVPKQQVDLKAPLASPALTGTPTVPTAPVNTNTTQAASTAFVNAEIANDAPTKTGGGASGTWPVSITGSASDAYTVGGIHFHFHDPGGTQPYLWTGNAGDPLNAKLMLTSHLAPASHGYHPTATGTTVFTTDGAGQGRIELGTTYNTIVQCNGDFVSHPRAVSLRGDYGTGFGLTNMDPNRITRCNWIAT